MEIKIPKEVRQHKETIFFSYNGMTLEQFAWAFIKSEILCTGERRFISKNFHYELIKRKGVLDFD